MFLALLWSYEYNEHVQNLEPSTKIYKNLQVSGLLHVWICLELPGLDTKRPNTEILQNLEFKILCSHARKKCMSSLSCLHVESSRNKPLPSAWSQNLQTSDLLRRFHNPVRSHNGAMTISYESYRVISSHIWNQALPWPSKNWQESNAGTGSAQEILEVSRSDLKSPSQASMVAVHRNKVYSMGM